MRRAFAALAALAVLVGAAGCSDRDEREAALSVEIEQSRVADEAADAEAAAADACGEKTMPRDAAIAAIGQWIARTREAPTDVLPDGRTRVDVLGAIGQDVTCDPALVDLVIEGMRGVQ